MFQKMNWYIGQKVVYIGPDRYFDPNPGKTIHIIQAMRKAHCTCDHILIDVGKTAPGFSLCQKCGHETDTPIYWKRSEWFRPVIDDHTEEEIESVNIDELIEELCEPVHNG